MVEMSFKSFLFTPNNFLPKLDLRAMKWVVPTCLLGKPIMKINAVIFITLSKNDYKNPKSLYGENLQGDNIGILGSTRGQKTPNHVKICSPPA